MIHPVQPLGGTWHTTGASGAARRANRKTNSRHVVPTCLTCRATADERPKRQAEAVTSRLVNAEMERRVIAWLATKGLT